MLPRSKRVSKKDFVGIKPKVIFRGECVDVAVLKSSTLRAACVISKKKIRLAVDRNKVKRRVYHIIQGVKTKDPYFVFIYPKQKALTVPHKIIKAEILSVFDTI